MKKIILIFVGLIFFACTREVKVIDLRYDVKENEFIFHPKNITNFIALSNALDSIACENNIRPGLSISLKNEEFLFSDINEDRLMIQSGNGCPDVIYCKVNSAMVITNDWQDENFSAEMEEYIFNPNDRPDLAPKPSKAYFRFNLKTETSLEEIAKIIKKTALTFQKIQQKHPEVKLVFIPVLKFWNPPSPPPKLNSNF